ncbi:MAG: SulP family inorganic anion transporter [Marmoricola sp.]
MTSGLGWVKARAAVLTPSRQDLLSMGRAPRRDLVAGLTVGLVALPLALGFGISSGLGAGAGLVTAIVAGIVAALFGGSNLQISGPTGAMTVVLVPIVATYGRSGVLVVGLLAGLMLITMSVAGLGGYVRYIPLPVIEGFTFGIAIIIALQQVSAGLGVSGSGETVLATAWSGVRAWWALPQWWAPGITLAVIAVMWLTARVRPGVPGSLVAVVLATGVAELLRLDVARIGVLPSRVPVPHLPDIPWANLQDLLLPALAVAVLAALESLLSASVADAMSVSERHDPDRELFGQGLANLASPVFGGIPATAAIARTAVNVRSGARSRLSAVVHSVFLLAVILLFTPLVSRIPLAALAGILIATAIRMVEVGSLRALLRSGRGDAAVLIGTAIATVAFDLITAVVFGVVAAGALALRQMARTSVLEERPVDEGDHSDHDAEEHTLLDEHIVAYRLEGSLFFAAAHRALIELSTLSDVRVVILRMSRISTVDATGASVLRDTIAQLEQRGITVLLSGVREGHHGVLSALGVYTTLAHQGHLFDSTPKAIAHARLHVSRTPHGIAGPS